MYKKRLMAFVLLMPLAVFGARAHPSLERTEARIAAPYKAVVKIPHGCKGSPTISVRVNIPEGVIGVKPMPKAGWTLATEKGPYAGTYEFYHGKKLAEGVKQITWTGGPLPDEHFDEFVLSGFIAKELAPGAALYFPVVQKCETGDLNWTQIPATGEDAHALEFPAPALRLTGGDDLAASEAPTPSPPHKH